MIKLPTKNLFIAIFCKYVKYKTICVVNWISNSYRTCQHIIYQLYRLMENNQMIMLLVFEYDKSSRSDPVSIWANAVCLKCIWPSFGQGKALGFGKSEARNEAHSADANPALERASFESAGKKAGRIRRLQDFSQRVVPVVCARSLGANNAQWQLPI
jgi:hypothetical protein